MRKVLHLSDERSRSCLLESDDQGNVMLVFEGRKSHGMFRFPVALDQAKARELGLALLELSGEPVRIESVERRGTPGAEPAPSDSPPG